MLTVQMMISSVEADIRNGSSPRRYHGNMTGAHKSDAAIGQANRSGDHSGAALLSQIAFDLRGRKEIHAMWHMICAPDDRTSDIRATFNVVHGDDLRGQVSLVDDYTFS